ncbi:MAG: PEP-CTERM sorting domain-containing protein [Planctomycetota bacterium]
MRSPGATPLALLATAIAIAPLGVAHASNTAFDESVSGDLSDGGAEAPSPVSFVVGSNVVTGSVASGSIGDTRDYWTFDIDPGLQLEAVLLLEYDDPNSLAGTLMDGNRGFYSLLDGVSGAIPGAGFANLGGNHLDPLGFGADLLAPIAAGGISGGTGFDTPLGPGTYTFQVQQTGSPVSNYSLSFVIAPIPEPATAWLLTFGLTTIRRRRR